jgi:homoserine dehydrogenase
VAQEIASSYPSAHATASQSPGSCPVSRVGVGLLGCGVVGSEVARLLLDRAGESSQRCGIALELVRVAVKHPGKARPVPLEGALLTTDAASVVHDPDIDVVVEVIGGIEPARTLVLAALKAGKSVVTANKQLIARYGSELFATAQRCGAKLRFEASVGGAIPLIRVLSEALAGEEVRRIVGILNGTSNYVLSRLADTGGSVDQALQEARRLGYAERDPRADIDGHDAAAKAAVIAAVAFGITPNQVRPRPVGIGHITQADIRCASQLGFALKPVVSMTRHGDSLDVWVGPALVPRANALASADGVSNAVVVESEAAGQLVLKGQGAGGLPTASAVVGDILAVSKQSASARYAFPATGDPVAVTDETDSAYVFRFEAPVTSKDTVSAVLSESGTGDGRACVLRESEFAVISGHLSPAHLRESIAALTESNLSPRTILRVLDDDGIEGRDGGRSGCASGADPEHQLGVVTSGCPHRLTSDLSPNHELFACTACGREYNGRTNEACLFCGAPLELVLDHKAS